VTEENFYKQPTQPGISSSQEPASEIPNQIGPYKIESLLEKGGMSILYLSSHPETGEPTTIKVLLPKFLSSPEVTKRFLDEAEIISMTDHPNIVRLDGYGEWEEGFYIAMEFIEGISLRQLLLRKPLTLKQALEILLDIAYALCHLHTHGVIHRDLKPENILITEKGVVKVIDFGIAQLLAGKGKEAPSAKPRVIGTPIYMSPEQRDRPDSVGVQSDIYSLGIIAYELILGRLSHGRIHLSLMPKGMQKILSRALQPRPEERHRSMVHFIEEVTVYLHSASFEKESPPKDRIAKLSEGLAQAESFLTGQPPSSWELADLSFRRPKRELPEGFALQYLDFSDGRKALFMAEANEEGALGIIGASALYGMAAPLAKISAGPEEFFKEIDACAAKSAVPAAFRLNMLLFKEKEQQARLLTKEGAALWHLPSLKEGEEASWKPGETLFLMTYRCRTAREEEYLKAATLQFLQENSEQLPDRLTSDFLRKIKNDPQLSPFKETVTLFSAKRIA